MLHASVPPLPPLLADLVEGLSKTAEEVVPWFAHQMPHTYFLDTDHETRLAHLRAIVAARASGQPLSIALRNREGTVFTIFREQDRPGLLAQLLSDLPDDQPLRGAKVYSAREGGLVLDVFEFGDAPGFDPDDPEQADKAKSILSHGTDKGVDEATTETHLRRSSAQYLASVTPLRFFRHLALYGRVAATDGCAIDLEDEEASPDHCRIAIAVSNARPRRLLERCAALLGRHSINIFRAYLDVFEEPTGYVSLISFVVQGPDGRIHPESDLWKSVRLRLLRMKWMDRRALELFERHTTFGLERAEVLMALCALVHQKLSRENPYAFARDRIVRLAERHIERSRAIVDLFWRRFDPASGQSSGERQASTSAQADYLRQQIVREVDPGDDREVLLHLLEAVSASLRTNLFLESRYALSIRVDAAFLPNPDDTPFGVFFVHGAGFDGFHVRFRDIARGGVRAVQPKGAEQYALEADRLYQEAYGLAFAQQLKNKDIPEGGSKAVVLVAPDASIQRSVKAFANSLIDLLTPDPEVRRHCVDFFDREEVLYLGPDENISPELIDWIVACAERRGYPLARAFMSSKPGAGINHKVYGVTSEGVTVFLDVALRSVGIDPSRQDFTVKLTGGPDGDVAGNEIKILHREYGERAKIVGIADGSGIAEDPAGLSYPELLRLVDASLPIASFDAAKLSPKGRVVSVDDENGHKLRNTLHFRLKTDAFVPAGGRPQTINVENCDDYFTPEGEPCSRVIVEGANLFITPEARKRLFERGGVIIVKDSSANKCGVICSGYEIIASMLLSEEEFLANKRAFVDEVLVKLREFARREAELLFRERAREPDEPLPELSVRLSRCVARLSDAIFARLDHLGAEEEELCWNLVIDHLPPILAGLDRRHLESNVPREYWKWTIAKALAGSILYQEGTSFVTGLGDRELADLALLYLRQDQTTQALAREVEASGLQNKEAIAALLRRGGTRAALFDSWSQGLAGRKPT